MSKSNIPTKVKIELAARAGGRCEICNRYLFSDFFHKKATLAEDAHILPDSKNGPRYKEINISDLKRGETVDNLMFLCPSCHASIDKNPDFYSVDTLLRLKAEHENTIYKYGKLIKNKRIVKAVKFSSYIGENEINIVNDEIVEALLDCSMTYDETIIDLSTFSKRMEGESLLDYFDNLSHQLERNFKDKIVNSLNCKDPVFIALFALAPQPLLVKLGRFFNNTYPLLIFSKTRKNNWKPFNKRKPLKYLIVEPEEIKGKRIVLSLEISGATSASEMIDGDIWRITIDNPRFDAVTCNKDIDSFGAAVEETFSKIKDIYGVNKEINVYLALPQSLAIKFGSVYMPRAFNKLVLYDKDKNGNNEPVFVKALKIY